MNIPEMVTGWSAMASHLVMAEESGTVLKGGGFVDRAPDRRDQHKHCPEVRIAHVLGAVGHLRASVRHSGNRGTTRHRDPAYPRHGTRLPYIRPSRAG